MILPGNKGKSIFVATWWRIIKKASFEALVRYSTQSRSRTGMPVKTQVFETSASTNSAIWAFIKRTAKVANLC